MSGTRLPSLAQVWQKYHALLLYPIHTSCNVMYPTWYKTNCLCWVKPGQKGLENGPQKVPDRSIVLCWTTIDKLARLTVIWICENRETAMLSKLQCITLHYSAQWGNCTMLCCDGLHVQTTSMRLWTFNLSYLWWRWGGEWWWWKCCLKWGWKWQD